MLCQELRRAIDVWATGDPDGRGYGYADGQREWRFDPAVGHVRVVFFEFLEEIQDLGIGGTFVQIGLGRNGGSHFGLSLLAERVVTVELDPERVRRFKANGGARSERDLFVVGDSGDPRVLAELRALVGTVDLLLIDGEASYAGVKRNWEMYAPLVRSGGVVAVVDRSRAELEHRVQFDVDRFVLDLEVQYLEPRGLSWRRIGSAEAIHFYESPTGAGSGFGSGSESGAVAGAEPVALVLPRGFRAPKVAQLIDRDFEGMTTYRYGECCYAVPAGSPRFDPRNIRRAQYEVVLQAESPDALRSCISTFRAAAPGLRRVRAMLAQDRVTEALAYGAEVLAAHPDYRRRMISSLETYRYSRRLLLDLGTAGVVTGHAREGVHLLRHALDQDLVADDLLSVLSHVYQDVLRDDDGARDLIDYLKLRLRRIHLEVCSLEMEGHVLWDHAQFLTNVRGVIQVGAHVGAEVGKFARLKIPNQAYFEPMPAAFAVLQRECAVHAQPEFEIKLLPVALADAVGSRTLYHGPDVARASLLRLSSIHSDASQAEALAEAQTEAPADGSEVVVTTLDQVVADGLLDPKDYQLLFVDTEGSELDVLRGARGSLRHVDVVCVAVFFERVYEGSATPDEIADFLGDEGFTLRDFAPRQDPARGDSVFVRGRRRMKRGKDAGVERGTGVDRGRGVEPKTAASEPNQEGQ